VNASAKFEVRSFMH